MVGWRADLMATFARGYSARTLNTKNATFIHTLSGHTQTQPHKITWTNDPADTLTLRGIPAIGRGVAGQIRGTRPDTNPQ